MTGEQEKTQLEALYGPLATYSEHKVGDIIKFRSSRGELVSSKIVWVQQPHSVYVGGPVHPTTYIMLDADPDTGMPFLVYPGEVEANKE